MSAKRESWTPKRIKELFDSVNLIINDTSLDQFSYSKPIRCMCKQCGNKTKKSVKSLQYTGTKIGCQKCSMKAKSLKSMKTTLQAEQILKSVGLTPKTSYPGSQVPWQSRCINCNRDVSRPLSDIQAAIKRWKIKSACAYCNGNRVDEQERLELLEKFGLIPMERYINNKTPHAYKCAKCGKYTRQTYINIKRKVRSNAKSYGCPQCSFNDSGTRRSIDFREVKKRFLEAKLEVVGEYRNARTLVDCVCIRCNRKVKQTLNGINNGKGCRFCSPKGIKYGEPSYLYLIRNPNLNALKIGIGNQGKKNDRLHIHIKKGWEVEDTWHFKTAERAKTVEQAVLKWIRLDRKLDAKVSRKDMPQGGHSETVDMALVSSGELKRKIAQIVKENKRLPGE